MLLTLPTAIDPFRFARQGVALQGSCDVSQMQRLVSSVHLAHNGDCLSNDNNHIEIDWAFSLYQQRYPRLQGHLTATLNILCCRCLTGFIYPLTFSTDLLFITDRQEERLIDSPDLVGCEFHALDINNPKVSLADVLENELLLALPLTPSHDVCPDNQYTSAIDNNKDALTIVATEDLKPNPFQVLAQLKNKG